MANNFIFEHVESKLLQSIYWTLQSLQILFLALNIYVTQVDNEKLLNAPN